MWEEFITESPCFNDLNLKEYFLISESELIGFYSYTNKDDGSIQTKKIWNSKNHTGIIRKFFAEYIVPKFKVVESDDMLTAQAFEMWRKMMVLYSQYNYYVKDNGELHKITNPEEFLYYKEPMNIDRPNSTFIVEYDS